MNIERRSFRLHEVRFLARKKDTDDDSDEGNADDEVDDEDDDGEEDRSIATGYAIRFNSDSEDLGGFKEIVNPAALTRSLSEAKAGTRNIYAYWSHDDSQVIGSTGSRTLKLRADDNGLAFDLDTRRLNPMQVDALRSGDMRMSFGFVVNDDDWTQRDDGTIQRELRDIDLFEVSPVTTPAYADTSAAMRGLEQFRSTKTSNAEARADPARAVALRLKVTLAQHLCRPNK